MAIGLGARFPEVGQSKHGGGGNRSPHQHPARRARGLSHQLSPHPPRSHMGCSKRYSVRSFYDEHRPDPVGGCNTGPACDIVPGMADSYEYDLVCIGSGPAGQRAAVQAAKLGKTVAVVEERRSVGGCCVMTGTIPSKTFRQAALSFVGLQPNSAHHPAEHPTSEGLLARVDDVVRRESEVVSNQLWRNNIEVLGGRGQFADPHTVDIVNGGSTRTVTAANILLAVGTRPAGPPGVTLDQDIIITSRGVLNMKDLPKTMVVVGGGVIGIEYASIFGAIGVRVTVVDRQERPLEFLDREIVDELIHQMRENNVTFLFGESVESLSISESDGPRGCVVLESGKQLVADLVLYAIGRQGSTDTLNLEAAGLDADKRGRLSVDDCYRTSVPHIFAAGDAIGFPSLAATSSEQGRLAALHAFDQPAKPMPDHFPIGIYSIPEVSMVGLPEHELTAQKVPYVSGLARYREIARGQILGDNTGLYKMLFHREDRRLLGVHAIGTGATEIIHIGQAVLALGGGLDYFLETVFNYPTLAECLKVAALDAHNKLLATRV